MAWSENQWRKRGIKRYMVLLVTLVLIGMVVGFGNGSLYAATFCVDTAGAVELSVGNVAQANGLAAPFSISNDGCSGGDLAHAESCVLEIRFAPAALNYFSDSFDVPSSYPITSSAAVTVHGVGDTAASGGGGGSGSSGGGGGGCFISLLLL